jgi:hypothetical protein
MAAPPPLISSEDARRRLEEARETQRLDLRCVDAKGSQTRPRPVCRTRAPADAPSNPPKNKTNSYQGLDRVPADLLELLVASYNPDVADLDLSR